MTRDLVLSATFVALAVALGFSLAQVPNVELVTLVVYLSGSLLGARRGFYIGLCGMSMFTIFNPMGLPVLPVALAQVVSMAAIGLIGGASRDWIAAGLTWAKLGLLGLACTLFYDLITNTVMAACFGLIDRLFAVMIAGLTFSVLHMVSNVVIFAAVGPLLTRMGPRWRKNSDR